MQWPAQQPIEYPESSITRLSDTDSLFRGDRHYLNNRGKPGRLAARLRIGKALGQRRTESP